MNIKAEVLSIVEQLSPDELRVFRFMGRRMIDIGHVKYGALDLAVMRRLWRKEMAQETADRLFYEQCYEIAQEDARADRVRCFAADEAFRNVDAALTAFASASSQQALAEDEDLACTDCLGLKGKHAAGCPWLVVLR